MYGVSDKAIRDIWNGRTWRSETKYLDSGDTQTVIPPEVAALSPQSDPYDEPQIGKKRGRDSDTGYERLLADSALQLLTRLHNFGLAPT